MKCVVDASNSYLFREKCLKTQKLFDSKTIELKLDQESDVIETEIKLEKEFDHMINEENEIKVETNIESESENEYVDQSNELDDEYQEDDNEDEDDDDDETKPNEDNKNITDNSEPKSTKDKIVEAEIDYVKKNKNKLKIPQCNICQKTFTSVRSLLNHLETHSSKPKYYCKICGKKTFTHIQHLKHLRTHRDTARECMDCQKKFASNSDLARHLTQKHCLTDLCKFDCNICEETFKHKQLLKVSFFCFCF